MRIDFLILQELVPTKKSVPNARIEDPVRTEIESGVITLMALTLRIAT